MSRGKGKSAVAAAAYRSGEKLTNEWDGMTHDYTRKGGVVIPKLWESFKKSLTQEEEEEMKVYTHTDQMPDWAQSTFRRLIDAEIVKVDKAGEIEVYEPSVQPMVYLDRLCGGQIEKLPEAIKVLQGNN